jgi:tetratricopeptide (TPR) repeat protein
MESHRNHYLLLICSVLLFFRSCGAQIEQALQNYLLLQYQYSIREGTIAPSSIDWVSRLAHNAPESLERNRIAGMYFLANGDSDKALSYLLYARELEVNNPVTSYWLAKAYEQSDNPGAALVAMHPVGLSNYFPEVSRDFSAMDWERVAQELMDSTITPHAHSKLAKQIHLINPLSAHHHFDAAYYSAPVNLEYSLGTAWFYYEQDDLETAMIFAERAVAIQPEHAGVALIFGKLNQKKGNLVEAVQEYEKALTFSPAGSNTSFTANLELGRLYNALGEHHLAVTHLKMAEAIQADDLSVYLQFTLAYTHLGYCVDAQQNLQRAYSLISAEHLQEQYIFYVNTWEHHCEP